MSDLSAASAVGRAWRLLPAKAHEKGISSGAGDRMVPTRRTKSTILPRILLDSPASSRRMSKMETVTDREAATIMREVLAAGPLLISIVDWMASLEAERWRAGIRGRDRREELLPIAVRLAETLPADLPAESRSAAAAAQIRTRYFGGTTRSAMIDAALADDNLVSELERTLDVAWGAPPVPASFARESAELDSLLVKELDSLLVKLLDQFIVKGDSLAVRNAAESKRLWAAIVRHSAVDVIHHRARVMGLSERDVPERPAITGGLTGDVAPLDRSLQRRLRSLLGPGSDERRAGLPGAEQLLRLEAEASGQPLGLMSAAARATIAVAVKAYSGFSLEAAGNVRRRRAHPQPAATLVLNRRLARRLVLIEAAFNPAKYHPLVIDQLDDPQPFLMRKLWVRMRGLESRSKIPSDPLDVWKSVSMIVSSFLNDTVSRRATLAERGVQQVADDENDLDLFGDVDAEPEIPATPEEAASVAAAERQEDEDAAVRAVLTHVVGSEGLPAVSDFRAALDSADRIGECAARWDGWCDDLVAASVAAHLENPGAEAIAPRKTRPVTRDNLPSFAVARRYLLLHWAG